MCEPTTLMILGTITSVVGTFVGAKAAADQAKFQQKIALDNAARTSERMRDARERGAREEQRVLGEGAVAIANTRGALASNNMDLTFGSPLDTIIETSVAVDQDAFRVRRNTEREHRDLEVKRFNYLNSASASGTAATNAMTAGFISGVGTALGGYSNVLAAQADIG